MQRLFEAGHYYAQPWDCAAPIQGRLLNGVRRLFDEIRYVIYDREGLIFISEYIYFHAFDKITCIYCKSLHAHIISLQAVPLIIEDIFNYTTEAATCPCNYTNTCSYLLSQNPGIGRFVSVPCATF